MPSHTACTRHVQSVQEHLPERSYALSGSALLGHSILIVLRKHPAAGDVPTARTVTCHALHCVAPASPDTKKTSSGRNRSGRSSFAPPAMRVGWTVTAQPSHVARASGGGHPHMLEQLLLSVTNLMLTCQSDMKL